MYTSVRSFLRLSLTLSKYQVDVLEKQEKHDRWNHCDEGKEDQACPSDCLKIKDPHYLIWKHELWFPKHRAFKNSKHQIPDYGYY